LKERVILPLYFYIKKRKRRRFSCASSHRHTPIFFKYNFNEKLNHLLITNRTSFFPKPIHLWCHWICHATGIFCRRRFPPRNVISPAGIWTILKFRDQLLREISIIKVLHQKNNLFRKNRGLSPAGRGHPRGVTRCATC
jgi:hypothetical protein